jgi:hypothetical protein
MEEENKKFKSEELENGVGKDKDRTKGAISSAAQIVTSVAIKIMNFLSSSARQNVYNGKQK